MLIIKAPSDIKEQKKFLGYEWSNRKGDEGLKELYSPYLSPLFERDNPKNETKLNALIYKSFLNTLNFIPEELRAYATKAKLIDMIDFEKVEFNKAISLNPKTQRREIKSKYPLVKLETCGDFFMGGTPSRKNSSYWNGEIKWLTIGDYSNHQVITDTKEKITQQGFKDSNAKMIQKGAVVVSIYATIGRVGILGESMTTNQAIVSIVPNEWFINKYLMYAIDYFKFQLFNETITTSQKNINLGILQNMIIPKPPLEIQKQIVAECEKIEEQYHTIKTSIEEYQKLIQAILFYCGIIDSINQSHEVQTAKGVVGVGGEVERGKGATSQFKSLHPLTKESGLESILQNLQKLESQLDFNLLLVLIEEQVSYSNIFFSRHSEGSEATEESHNKEKQDFNTFKDFSKTIQELLQTLPTPPQNGWERISLKNEKYIELNPSKKEISELDENMLVSFIEMASISDKGYIESKVDKPLKEVRKGYTYFVENDILIAKITPCMENGKCAIAKNLTNHIGFGSTEFHIFRAKTGLDSSFLFYNLNQQNIREKAALAMTGASGHKRVPISFYENLTIPLPPLEVQEKIVQTIEAVENQISFVDSKLARLESQKEVILKKYLEADNERENR